jgi:hypothetical protein
VVVDGGTVVEVVVASDLLVVVDGSDVVVGSATVVEVVADAVVDVVVESAASPGLQATTIETNTKASLRISLTS